MKIIKYLCLSAIALSLAGCYEDLGTYDYADLKEPEIVFPNYSASIEVFSGETLKIEAKVNMAEGRTIDDYTFEWFIDMKKVGEGPVLEVQNFTGIAGSRNTNRLVITDKANDSKYIQQFSIKTFAPMQSGWAILSDDAGNTTLHFLRETRLKDPDDPDVVVGHEFKFFKDYLTGLPASPTMLYEHWSTKSGALGEVAVLCAGNQAWELDGFDLSKVVDLKTEFQDMTFPADLHTDGILYQYQGSYVYTKDGNMYGRTNNDLEGYHTGRYIPIPVQPLGGGMKVGFTVGLNTGKSCQSLVYDIAHNRYIVIGDALNTSSYAGLVVPILSYDDYWVDPEEIKKLDLLNMGDVKIYGCATYIGGYFDAPYYALLEKDGKYLMQKFEIYYSGGKAEVTGYEVREINWGNLLKDDMQILIQPDSKETMFFTSDDKIYFNDIDESTPTLFESFDGVKVSSIALEICEYGWYDWRNIQLGVGLEDGRFIVYDVSSAQLTKVAEGGEPVIFHQEANLGKIKSVIYKLGINPSMRPA